MQESDEEAERFRVIRSEAYEAELDKVILSLLGYYGSQFIGAWVEDLDRAIVRLTEIPGPRGNPLAYSPLPGGVEVRRLLYYGPRGRRSGAKYRILYAVVPPGNPGEETVIRILSIRHAARATGTATRADEENEE